MVSSTTQSSYAKQRSKAIEIGFDSLLTLSQQSEKVSFMIWSARVQRLAEPNWHPKGTELLWLWETLTHDPELPLELFKKILSPEEEFKSRKPVLAAYAGSEFGIFLHSLPYLEVPFRVNEVKPHAWIYLIEDLYMEPGRSMRFKCRSTPCDVTFTVSDPREPLVEAAQLRLDPDYIRVRGNQIQAYAESLSNAYAVATRRLQPERRSEGGKA